MAWKHYSSKHSTEVPATADTVFCTAVFEIGSVHTGKSRMHAGYFCRIRCAEHDLTIESATMAEAVIKAVEQLNDAGVAITVYAVLPNFAESGLSFNTGWGYLDDAGDPVLMIESPENKISTSTP